MCRLKFAFVAALLFWGTAPALAQSSERHISEAFPAGAKQIAAGVFRDGDPAHIGSGLLKILIAADGQTILRLENLKVKPGPDLYVYLAKDPDPLFPEDVTAAFVSLGDLKGQTGNQNYVVPKDIDLSDWRSVAVWCEAYKVLFAVATIDPN